MYKDRIHRDYEACKKNPKQQQKKARFDYLHDKLSHIKRLIVEYETAVASDNGAVSVISNTNATNVVGVNSRHY